MEIPELRKKVAEIEAENTKLRHIIEENARRDAENAEHKARIEELEKNSADTSAENAELKARVVKLEQESSHSQNDFSPSVDTTETVTVHSPVCEINDAVPEAITVPTNSAKHLQSTLMANGKPLEEKDMDSFLLEAHKKIVSS